MNRRLALSLAVATVLLVAGFIAFRSWPKSTVPVAFVGDDDPRRIYAGPYLNIEPEAPYAVAGACAECHEKIAATYARHPMGQSLAPLSEAAGSDQYGAEFKNPFVKFGNTFQVERRDGKVFHREERRDENGRPIAASVVEAAFVIGSGTRGKSYIVQRGTHLFQSPISWFAEAKFWDISPGYPEGLHFNRPIDARCLFCHGNRVDPIAGSINSFREPVFHGHAIGCERCHGPGELHVQRRKKDAPFPGRDFTIVNPRDLTPALRDAVCEQCHLQGDVRVLRRGREPFDFRPGLALESFWSVFVRLPELDPGSRSVGQVEQMQQSRCWQATSGKLGCISCHDPHERPPDAKRVEHYRDRCLTCHADKGCKLDVAVRKQQQADDSCIACHMSKAGSTNIPHTAVTDHRIPRRPEPRGPRAPRALSPGEVPLLHFHRDRPGLDANERDRDLGLALAQLQQRAASPMPGLAQLAWPLIDAAADRHADDIDAWSAKAGVLRQSGRLADALTACEHVLALAPREERVLTEAAQHAARLDQPEAAVAYWRRAIDVNPWEPRYQYELARVHAERGDWPQVCAACETLLQLDPFHADARVVYIIGLIRTGDKDRAKTEFELVLKMRPKEAAELRRWFENQMK